MRLFYTLSIRVYFLLLLCAAKFGNKKASLWLSGRTKWQEQLKQQLPKDAKIIWFHAASLGEFEQARPLIDKVKQEKPNYYILLSFFSPSGYEVQKNYAKADLICYLPLDTPSNAKKFIQLTQPEIAIFVKYEFWFNYLTELKKRRIPTYLVSGIFRPSQHFFKWYGAWFRNQLKAFHTFFLQNNASEKLLHQINFNYTLVTGDTRFDRVHQLAKQPYQNNTLIAFCNQQPTIIFGSSWEKENEFARQLAKEKQELKIFLAPHEIEKNNMQALKKSFEKPAVLWSEITDENKLSNNQVLIIDQIGMLSKIYRYATIAMIGGGFGAGIHNVLEAAVYGCPVVFGPNYKKFQEAKDLISVKGGFSVADYASFKKQVETLLAYQSKYRKSALAAEKYVNENAGATQQIYQEIFK